LARQRLCVGVDIGASSIKLCQLRRAPAGYVVEAFAVAPLPQETIVDGTMMNASRVVETLARLLSDPKFKNRRAALAISGNSVIIKKIPMPKMTQSELDASIQYEAGQFIPFATDDCYIDARILGAIAPSTGQMDVVLVAAKKDFVNDYVAAVTEAGLEPVICDVDAFALEHSFLANSDSPTSDAVLINVGASKTNINVLCAGVSAFTRDISVGGFAHTEEIQKSFRVSFEEAEKLKVSSGRERQMGQAFIGEVDDAIARVNRLLVDEIRHSLDFFSASSNQAAPPTVYLSGGGAMMASLVDALKEGLSRDVQVVDPFRKMAQNAVLQGTLEGTGPGAAVVVGLALRALGDS
jgi:type IV pilus assembly protein PilM